MNINNELIIGLGGCGGRSIKEFRRTTVLRDKDFEYIKSKGTLIDYLYIDSNNDILNANDWSVLGKNIRLDPNQIIELKQSGTTSDIDEISKYPHISPWIGDLKDSFRSRSSASGDDEVQKTLQTMRGAGQLRRYGRVLFALNSSMVRNTLEAKIDRLVTGRKSEVTFRIFTTLGGGTGSGSLIDMITLIQSICENKGIERSVIVYAYVAASKAQSADAGFFYENEYCSLRDLNALMVRHYNPVVTGMPFTDVRDAQFDLPKSVSRVYISSDLAPGTPELADQVKSITAACFDSIVYAHSYEDPNCLKAVSDEDLVDVTPAELDSKGKAVRSYRFAALGSRRWRVPTTHIRELLTHETEARVWKSLLNGTELPDGIVRDINHLEGFRLDYGMTNTAEEYKKIEADILSQLKTLFDSIHTQNRRDDGVLPELKKKAEELQVAVRKLGSDQSRKLALSRSYQETTEQIRRELLRCLDSAVTWNSSVKTDVWGMRDVHRYLNALRVNVSAWMANEAPGSAPEEIEKVNTAITDYMGTREREWEKMGLLTIRLTKLDERMIEAQYEDARSLVLNSLKAYKKTVLTALIETIDRMLRDIEISVGEFEKRMEASHAKACQLSATLLKELSEHAENSGAQGMKDMYVFDFKNLKAMKETMAAQVKLHESEMQRCSEALRKAVGGDPMVMCGSEAKDKFEAELRNGGILNEVMVKVHDAADKSDASLQSVLVGDIIERLVQIGGTVEDNWESRLGQLVEQFMKNMPMSAEIQAKDGLTQPQVSPAAALVIGLPNVASKKGNEGNEVNKDNAGDKLRLLKWFEEKIKRSRLNKYTILSGRMEFYEHETPEEIRVLYVPYWMPCRFMTVSEFVEKKYKATVEQQDAAKIYFANYDISGEDGKTGFRRPALTKEGEPDTENVQITELMERLFIRVNGEVKKLIVRTDKGILFAKDVDKLDGVVYADEYSETQVQFPGRSYKRDRDNALRMAVRAASDNDLYESMTREEKLAVYELYKKKVDEMPEGSGDWTEARNLRDLVRRLLELN